MGTLVVTEFVTLDGVVEDPGGAEGSPYGGWAFTFERGDEGDAFKYEELMSAEVQLLGRRTYEGFAEAWPSRTGDFADKINNGAKYVVSSTLRDPSWQNTTVIGIDDVAGVKEQVDGNILVAGSVQLVHELFRRGLVDELRLMVFPIAVGGGKRLFAEGVEATSFELVDARRAGETTLQVLRRKA